MYVRTFGTPMQNDDTPLRGATPPARVSRPTSGVAFAVHFYATRMRA